MKEEQKLQMISEIKQIERELYLKRSKVASSEAMDDMPLMLPYIAQVEGLDTKKWKEAFSKLIAAIGSSSIGGNSVDDVHIERQS